MRQHKAQKGFHIYGRNAIHEVLLHTPDRIAELIVIQDGDGEKNAEVIRLAHSLGIQTTKIDRNRADKIFGSDTRTQGIGAYYRGFVYSQISDVPQLCTEDKLNVILFLDRIEDVQNFGAMVRTATAVGACAVIVAEHDQAPVNAAVFTTSAGTVTRMPIIQVSSVAQAVAKLKEHDFWTYGIDMEEEVDRNQYTSGSIWKQKFDANTVIVVGAEGRGLSAKAKAACDFIAPIPMENDVESLNVSVAAAIALYEWKRQQG